jgi:hypothetical protein
MNTNQVSLNGNAFGLQSLAQMSSSMQRAASREIERVQAAALIVETREQGRAMLANAALQNVGALTALEQHLIKIAPLGEARYKHIVDGYTLGAVNTLARW